MTRHEARRELEAWLASEGPSRFREAVELGHAALVLVNVAADIPPRQRIGVARWLLAIAMLLFVLWQVGGVKLPVLP